MKKAIFALLMAGSVNVFAGYTAEVCQINEAGQQFACRTVYFDRDLGQPSKSHEGVYCTGDAQNTICDNKDAKVPSVLSDLNQWFLDHGFTPVSDNNSNAGRGEF